MRTAFPLIALTLLAIAGLASLVIEHPEKPLPEHIIELGIPLFADRSENLSSDIGGPMMTLAVADYDRDGWTDLAVSTGLSMHLLNNRAGNGFVDDPRQAQTLDGVQGQGIRGLAWVDHNQDRWPDLLMSMTQPEPGQLPLLVNQGGSLARASIADPVIRQAMALPAWSVLPWDLDRDGQQDRLVLGEAGQHLWLNGPASMPEQVGNLDLHSAAVFTASSQETRVLGYGPGGAALVSGRLTGGVSLSSDALPNWLDQRLIRSAALGDVDNDGDQDMYIASGHLPVNGAVAREDMVFFRFSQSGGLRVAASGEQRLLVWSNRGDGRRLWVGGEEVASSRFIFDWDDPALRAGIPAAAQPGVHLSRSGDELVAVVVTEPGTVVNGRLIASGGAPRLLASSPEPELRSEAACDVLLINQDGVLQPASDAQWASDCDDAADAAFGDFDNDGDLDLMVLKAGWPLRRPLSTLYRNDGTGAFSPWEMEMLPSAAADPGASLLPLDYDKDGMLDLVVTTARSPTDGNLGAGLQLWRNQWGDAERGGKWLLVELVSDSGDPFALGAEVTVRTGKRLQRRIVHPGDVPRGASLLPLHFGLGKASKAVVRVTWPSGATRRVEVTPNRRVRISEVPEQSLGSRQPDSAD